MRTEEMRDCNKFYFEFCVLESCCKCFHFKCVTVIVMKIKIIVNVAEVTDSKCTG